MTKSVSVERVRFINDGDEANRGRVASDYRPRNSPLEYRVEDVEAFVNESGRDVAKLIVDKMSLETSSEDRVNNTANVYTFNNCVLVNNAVAAPTMAVKNLDKSSALVNNIRRKSSVGRAYSTDGVAFNAVKSLTYPTNNSHDDLDRDASIAYINKNIASKTSRGYYDRLAVDEGEGFNRSRAVNDANKFVSPNRIRPRGEYANNGEDGMAKKLDVDERRSRNENYGDFYHLEAKENQFYNSYVANKEFDSIEKRRRKLYSDDSGVTEERKRPYNLPRSSTSMFDNLPRSSTSMFDNWANDTDPRKPNHIKRSNSFVEENRQVLKPRNTQKYDQRRDNNLDIVKRESRLLRQFGGQNNRAKSAAVNRKIQSAYSADFGGNNSSENEDTFTTNPRSDSAYLLRASNYMFKDRNIAQPQNIYPYDANKENNLESVKKDKFLGRDKQVNNGRAKSASNYGRRQNTYDELEYANGIKNGLSLTGHHIKYHDKESNFDDARIISRRDQNLAEEYQAKTARQKFALDDRGVNSHDVRVVNSSTSPTKMPKRESNPYDIARPASRGSVANNNNYYDRMQDVDSRKGINYNDNYVYQEKSNPNARPMYDNMKRDSNAQVVDHRQAEIDRFNQNQNNYEARKAALEDRRASQTRNSSRQPVSSNSVEDKARKQNRDSSMRECGRLGRQKISLSGEEKHDELLSKYIQGKANYILS